MTDITAAIGLRQLDRYPGLLERRDEIIDAYNKFFDEMGIWHLNHHTPEMDSSRHLYLIRVPGITEEQRNEIIKPLPMMTAYKKLGLDIKDFPNSYDYYHNLITIPLHTLLTDEDVEFICENVKAVLKG